MMVVEYCKYAVEDDVVSLPHPNVDRKENMYDSEDEEVELVFEKTSKRRG